MPLQKIAIKSQSERLQVIEAAISLSERVVIPDLQSKMALREMGLKHFPIFAEDHAPRSREFWLSLQKSFVRAGSSKTILVPKKIVKLMLEDWLPSQNISWAMSTKSVQVLLDVMDVFIDQIHDEQQFEVLKTWLLEHSTSLEHWAHWAILARSAFIFLESNRVWSDSWVKEYLLINHSQSIKNLNLKEIINFDLGNHIDDSELELIELLATNNTVKLLLNDADASTSIPPDIKFYRYGHELLEKAKLVSWVKDQIAGRPLEELVVVSANPKKDKLIIRNLLIQNDLVKPAGVGSLFSLPHIRRWGLSLISRFNLESYDQLEFNEFVKDKSPDKNFDLFFANTWSRVKDKNALRYPPQSSNRVTFEEFLFDELFKIENKIESSIGNLLHRLAMQIPASLKLTSARWASFIITEITDAIVHSVKDLKLLDFDSLLYMPDQSIFYSQLSEDVFIPSQFFRLVQEERFTLKKDIGWLTKGSNFLNRKSLLEWSINKPKSSTDILTFYEVDLIGNKLAPSLFYLENTKGDSKHSVVEAKDLTFGKNADYPWVEEYLQQVNSKQTGSATNLSVSASSLERYLKCPFVFKAEKLFNLQDMDQITAELGARSKGTFFHDLAAAFANFSSSKDDVLITQKVTEVFNQQRQMIYDEWFKESVIKSSVMWVKKYLKAEQALSDVSQGYLIVGHEVPFNAKINTETKQFLPLADGEPLSQNEVKIKGWIDRVEKRDNSYKVIDYKSSKRTQTYSDRWLETDQLQLIIYSLALEKGCTEFGAGTVEGALYYFFDKLERSRGLLVSDQQEPNFNVRYKISTEKKNDIFSAGLEKVIYVLNQTKSGEFNPNPKDIKDCEKCKWSDLCRAPHLQ